MIFIDFNFPNSNISKKWWLVTEISQLLYKNDCTFTETDEILKSFADVIKQQRKELEYNTLDDYFCKRKTRCVDNDVIQSLNHVEPYC